MVEVTDPWTGEVKVLYHPKNMFKSEIYKGLMGTVCDIKKDEKWDWAIELFLGTIWEHSRDDFNLFIKELFKVWLEEWLHMIYRFERVTCSSFCKADDLFHFWNEEKPVRLWVHMLTEI